MNPGEDVVMKTITTAILIAAACAAGGEKDADQTGQPAWGPAKMGLQLAAAPKNGTRVGGTFTFEAAMRNSAVGAVRLPAAEKVFGWMIFQQAHDQYFTARIDVAKGVKTWPPTLADGEKIAFPPFRVGEIAAYGFERGVKFISEYAAGRELEMKPAGPVNEVLRGGTVNARLYLYLESGDRKLLLKSAPLQVMVAPPDFNTLTPQAQQRFVNELLARFDSDPWSGKGAFEASTAVGRPIIEHLVKAAGEKKRPDHSRAWLVTAVCAIRDEKAVDALVTFLDDPAVRTIVAYHGPKQRSDRLDAAITAKAAEVKDARFTAYALMGYITFARTVPRKLLKLGLDSDDPRARSSAVSALKTCGGGHETLRSLAAALEDKEPRVRSAAARVMGVIGSNAPKAIEALVGALDRGGDKALLHICEALSRLAGREVPYPAAGTAAEKKAAVENWKEWYRSRK